MSNQQLTVKSLLSTDAVKQKFSEILQERAAGFTANLAVMVNNSAALSKCNPMSIVSAAVVSASLNLPLDPNLGFAAVVPYGDKATFQIMYKGLIQLAMRTGQYKTIGVTEIYEGELISQNRLTGIYVFDFDAKVSDRVIGYAAYFSLINGFEKTIYWDIAKVKAHGQKYSQSFRKGYGLWNDDFDSMASKTVLKSLISKWGILSIEMQSAIKFDQGVVKDIDGVDVEYIDNDGVVSFDDSEPVSAKKVVAGKEEKVESTPTADGKLNLEVK
jgi:recombination protein RecT